MTTEQYISYLENKIFILENSFSYRVTFPLRACNNILQLIIGLKYYIKDNDKLNFNPDLYIRINEVRKAELISTNIRLQKIESNKGRNGLKRHNDSTITQISGFWIRFPKLHYCTFNRNLIPQLYKKILSKKRSIEEINKLSQIKESCTQDIISNTSSRKILTTSESESHNIFQKIYSLDKSKKTLIIVSHELSRTGAPILALEIAKITKDNYNVILFALKGGVLEEEFIKECDLVIGADSLFDHSYHSYANILNAIKHNFTESVAIVNSICSNAMLKPLNDFKIEIIHLIHEYASNVHSLPLFFESYEFSKYQIYPAKNVSNNTICLCPDMPVDKIKIMPQGIIKAPAVKNDKKYEEEETRVKEIFRPEGFASNGTVIVGIGSIDIRKGVDLFVSTAKYVKDLNPEIPIRFVWVGDLHHPSHEHIYATYIYDQIERSGLKETVVITKPFSNLDLVYNNCDIFYLSSRLDPLPLVSLEALSYSKPLVCFDDASGIAEYMKEDKCISHCIAPYQDVCAAAKIILKLANDVNFRTIIGKDGKTFVESKFDMSNYVKRIMELF